MLNQTTSGHTLEPSDLRFGGQNEPGSGWPLRFWAIFIGQALSLCGSALTQFVLLWWITDTTGSVSTLAIAGIVALLPQALLSPLGGVLADRYSRRLLMIIPDVVSAICMVVLIVLFNTESIEIWHIWVMLGIRSAMQAFQAPAAAASTYMLVPKSFLMRAAGLNQALQSMTVVIAAPLGALAISIMPIGWALSIDVITVLCAVIPLLIFSIPQNRAHRETATSIFSEFKEGLETIRNISGLTRLFLLLATTVLVIMPSYALLPLLVKQYFGGGANQVALMEGLSGIGMVIGGLAIAAMQLKTPIYWVLGGFAASCFAVALTALVPSSLFGVAVAWWVISGVCFVFGSAPLTALLQTIVPNYLQGRVLSIMNSIISFAAPVGLLLITPLGDIFDVRAIFVIAGLLGLLVSLSGYFSPTLLNLGREENKRESLPLQ
ncbi:MULTISPECIES: MFS transporter [Enterobacterales]|uniref:MFS transporter n=1 Tax=Enterobacterales TaxID=91347 RepID=UPI001FEF1E3E|nr:MULTISPECIES: MFS transporter [Enterobacterales]MDT7052017.1 MFS transporter [Providencia stuartii]UPG21485.1 MFS transporter [Klebsiella pneumoniae]UPG23540.1 MFS transporter [Klebsiella pneumoniae]UPG23955.1 MFS transporter [Providencia stuartii]UPG24267.1 MFS transporter [Providencia stuartii]